MNKNEKSNRLINEKSPYLLQHAYNPVDWYSWGEEAFEKAKNEDKPIFLSIGYSTCHWCHVMERESFEDEEVAEILNKHFVSIKVDREERPDIDNIYMTFCTLYTGSGGWPLTIIMTPDKKPFFAGTYIPKYNKYGRTGIINLLKNIEESWVDKRQDLLEFSEKFKTKVTNYIQFDKSSELKDEIIEKAVDDLKDSFNSKYGGFGEVPKFPTPHNLNFLTKYAYIKNDNEALNIVNYTLESMYKGGIFDHIGYGFSRYSTDEKWLAPHFEKMLYDNALLALAYSENYLLTKNVIYKEVVDKIFTYISRVMTSPEGGFYSGEDADSEGVEGKFYVWTPNEIKEALGFKEGEEFNKRYDITEEGNFEGNNIPNLINNNLDISREEKLKFNNYIDKLFEVRESRIHPHKDDKILTSWNGLMIAAFAYSGRVLENKEYINSAKKSADFIINTMIDKNGRLYSRYRDGDIANKGFLEDYAFFVYGLIEIYQSTFDAKYLSKAYELTKDMIKYFYDKENGGFYIYGEDSEQLIMRPKEVYDGAMPSGNSVAIYNLLRLAQLTDDLTFVGYADKSFKTFGNEIVRFPRGYTMFLSSYLYNVSSKVDVKIVGSLEECKEIIDILNKKYHPFLNIILADDGEIRELNEGIKNLSKIENKPTAYICKNFNCLPPITDIGQIINTIYG
jgi:uncharacterized protein